jgi:tRNA A37 threonylcarbamoyltransferase TsaD
VNLWPSAGVVPTNAASTAEAALKSQLQKLLANTAMSDAEKLDVIARRLGKA